MNGEKMCLFNMSFHNTAANHQPHNLASALKFFHIPLLLFRRRCCYCCIGASLCGKINEASGFEIRMAACQILTGVIKPSWDSKPCGWRLLQRSPFTRQPLARLLHFSFPKTPRLSIKALTKDGPETIFLICAPELSLKQTHTQTSE